MADSKETIVTLSDIARKSGVSRQVVSAILNPGNNSNIRYSKKTYDKVMAVVEKSRYRPNRTAANLVSKRHGSIGVIVKNTGNIPGYCIQIMLDKAGEQDQVLSLESLDSGNDELPLFIREDCVDGLIIFEDLPEEHVKEIRRLQIPCIYVNNNMVKDAESITFNEAGAMEQAVEYLISKGRSHLAMFLPQSDHYSVKAREEGLKQALKRRNLPAPQIYQMGNNFYHSQQDLKAREEESDKIEQFLQRNPSIDGIVLYSERMVSLCYRALAHCHKEVPRDVSVMGISFSSAGLGSYPLLTTLRINPKELGTILIDEINKKINREIPSSIPRILNYELQENEST